MDCRVLMAVVALALAGGAVHAQKKATDAPPPPAAAQKPAESNPFPEDMSNVPLTGTVPSDLQGEPPAESQSTKPAVQLPRADVDPARSPDDPEPAYDEVEDANTFSSSLKGTESILPPDELEPGKRKAKDAPPPKTAQEQADDNAKIGLYYLQRKNWKAAVSRFESAMVLDPENPDIYWGLAEAERAQGEFARARTHYEKLLEIDPEGPRAKAAMKALKDPQIAPAKAEK